MFAEVSSTRSPLIPDPRKTFAPVVTNFPTACSSHEVSKRVFNVFVFEYVCFSRFSVTVNYPVPFREWLNEADEVASCCACYKLRREWWGSVGSSSPGRRFAGALYESERGGQINLRQPPFFATLHVVFERSSLLAMFLCFVWGGATTRFESCVSQREFVS